jgi:hypothetical protein
MHDTRQSGKLIKYPTIHFQTSTLNSKVYLVEIPKFQKSTLSKQRVAISG